MRPRPTHARGFTLVELLVTAVLGAVVIGSVAAYNISQLRSDTTQEINLQLRLEANRAAAWIDGEINRAAGFDNTAASGCTAPTGTALVLSMRSPDGATAEVSYFSPTGTATGSVVRCGPPVVCSNGTACELDTGAANVTYLVASDARLAVNPALSATPVRQLNYTLTIQEGTLSTAITRPGYAGAPTNANGVY
jgi:prepilin-type N-terminal cleavage/methylation domain-containing protein